MRRNSFPKEKVGGGNIPITFGQRGNIFDCGGTIFNTQLEITANVDTVHSLPSIYAPIYIYAGACKTSYPNSDFLFSQVLDLLEIIFNQNNLPIKLSISTHINVNDAVKDEEKWKNPFLSAIKMLNPDKIHFPNYQLIKCEFGGREEIIGITSPFTFVCPSANISNTYFYKNNPNFFRKPNPLGKRSDEFIAYVKDILSQINNTGIVEDENSNLASFRSHLKGELDKIKENRGNLPEFEDKAYNDTPFITITFKKKEDTEKILLRNLLKIVDVRSNYKIQPTKQLEQDVKPPLILRSGLTGKYFNEYNFPDNFKVAGNGGKVLPVYNYNYEWINPLSDFLEPTLVTLDYELNQTFLHIGKKKDSIKKCLLPLKPKFFEYFEGKDINELFEIELQPSGKEWRVKLNIPICGKNKVEYLHFEKMYTTNKRDITDTIGLVVSLKGVDCPYFAFWPALKSNLINDYYVFTFNPSDYSLETDCFSKMQNGKFSVKREKSLAVYKFKSGFPDYIQFSFSDRTEKFAGIVSPNSGDPIDFIDEPQKDMSEKVYVSIDFGTTNTNIGISLPRGKQQIWTFDNELLLQTIHKKEAKQNHLIREKVEDFEKLLQTYFLPEKICFRDTNSTTVSSTAQIPIGSLLLEVVDKNNIENKVPICNLNIPFYIEYGENIDNQLAFEFKWGEGNIYIEKFLSQLLIMLKVYFVKNRIDPRNVLLLAAYPMAYSSTQVSKIKELWQIITRETDFKMPRMMNEGSASKNFFSEIINSDLNIYDGTSIILDIGGGTTDFLITSNKESIVIDSLLYGGRDVIGWFTATKEDPGSFAKNPIVRYLEKLIFKEQLNKMFITNEYKKNVNSQLKFRYLMRSPNYFKLNELVLANPDFSFVKIILGYFYSSIFYYLGMLCCSKEETKNQIPSIICVGGNSSSFLDWLLQSTWETAANRYLVEELFNEFFQLGFGEVAGTNIPKFKVIKSDQPKNEVALGLLINPPERDEAESARYTKRFSIYGDNFLFENSNYSYLEQQSEKKADPKNQSYGKNVSKTDLSTIYISNQGESRISHFNKAYWGALNGREIFSDVFQSNIGKSFSKQAKEILINDLTHTNILREEINRYIKDTVSQDISTSFFILIVKGILHKLIREASVFVN